MVLTLLTNPSGLALEFKIFITVNLVIKTRQSGYCGALPKFPLEADEPIPQLLNLLSTDG